jgi:hypothetical protein
MPDTKKTVTEKDKFQIKNHSLINDRNELKDLNTVLEV